jgi:hypothetical protein
LAHRLGRGLLPRLSTGTLQLSMRCSSVHFGPSRSLPVRDAGERARAALRAGLLSSASAQNAKPTSGNAMTSFRSDDPMGISSNTAFRRRKDGATD